MLSVEATLKNRHYQSICGWTVQKGVVNTFLVMKWGSILLPIKFVYIVKVVDRWETIGFEHYLNEQSADAPFVKENRPNHFELFFVNFWKIAFFFKNFLRILKPYRFLRLD